MIASLAFPSFRYFSPSATPFCIFASGLCEQLKLPRTTSPTMSKTTDRPAILPAVDFTAAPRRGRTSHKSGTGLTLEKVSSKGTLPHSAHWPTVSNKRESSLPIQGLPLWVVVAFGPPSGSLRSLLSPPLCRRKGDPASHPPWLGVGTVRCQNRTAPLHTSRLAGVSVRSDRLPGPSSVVPRAVGGY